MTDPVSGEPTLDDLGVSKSQSATWQKMADASDRDFEDALARAVHKRMQVVLADVAAADAWIKADAATSTLRDLLVPAADDLVEAYPIGRAVKG